MVYVLPFFGFSPQIIDTLFSTLTVLYLIMYFTYFRYHYTTLGRDLELPLFL